MIELDYEALRRAPIGTDPFPHTIVPHFVPPDSLTRVLADLPALGKRGSVPPSAVRLGPAVQDLVQQLEGPELKAIIGERFGLDLEDAPTMLTIRGWTNERDGKIHVDSRAKRVTVLLYLNRENGGFSGHEGCLRLLRGPNDLEDYAAEVPPVNGTLLVFPNGPRHLARTPHVHGPALQHAAELHDDGRQSTQRAPAPQVLGFCETPGTCGIVTPPPGAGPNS